MRVTSGRYRTYYTLEPDLEAYDAPMSAADYADWEARIAAAWAELERFYVLADATGYWQHPSEDARRAIYAQIASERLSELEKVAR